VRSTTACGDPSWQASPICLYFTTVHRRLSCNNLPFSSGENKIDHKMCVNKEHVLCSNAVQMVQSRPLHTDESSVIVESAVESS
jgi:hypothetical protein